LEHFAKAGQNLLEALLLYQRIDVEKKLGEMNRNKKTPAETSAQPKM
jgi:hypothetical protein